MKQIQSGRRRRAAGEWNRYQPNPGQLDWIQFEPTWVIGLIKTSTVSAITHWHTEWLLFFPFLLFSILPPPHTHFRILQLNRGSLQIALWCIIWMQKSCHSSHTARYNMTLFESCVWSGDQQCNRGNPDSRLDITSNLLLTFPFFSLSLCSLSTYLFQSQNTMFPENISLEYFTTHSLSFTLSLSLFHPPSSRSLSARYNTYLFQE